MGAESAILIDNLLLAIVQDSTYWYFKCAGILIVCSLLVLTSGEWRTSILAFPGRFRNLHVPFSYIWRDCKPFENDSSSSLHDTLKEPSVTGISVEYIKDKKIILGLSYCRPPFATLTLISHLKTKWNHHEPGFPMVGGILYMVGMVGRYLNVSSSTCRLVATSGGN